MRLPWSTTTPCMGGRGKRIDTICSAVAALCLRVIARRGRRGTAGERRCVVCGCAGVIAVGGARVSRRLRCSSSRRGIVAGGTGIHAGCVTVKAARLCARHRRRRRRDPAPWRQCRTSTHNLLLVDCWRRRSCSRPPLDVPPVPTATATAPLELAFVPAAREFVAVADAPGPIFSDCAVPGSELRRSEERLQRWSTSVFVSLS